MDRNIKHFYTQMLSNIMEYDAVFYKHYDEIHSYEDLYSRICLFNFHLAGLRREVIGVYADKAFDSYACIYSIILSDNIWLPLSMDIPPERNCSIIDSSHPTLVFYNGNLPREIKSKLDTKDITYISFSDLNFFSKNSEFLLDQFHQDDIAYIMFTSGSTGTPKGVPMTHLNYINFVRNILEILPLKKGEVFSDFHDFAFDISIFYLFSVLFVEGAISPIIEQKDKIIPLDHITKNNVTVWASVPSVISRIMQLFRGKWLTTQKQKIATNINVMFLCGEPLKLEVMDYCFQQMKLKNVYNFYGLTETGVENFFYKCSPEDSIKFKKYGMVPIGKALPGNEVMISDEKELLIGGCQITPGYLNGVMKEKFLNIESKVWFKSGDIVEVYNDLYFCKGRMDLQIKINGHRVELLDIEANIMEYIKGVRQVICITKEFSNRQIIIAGLVSDTELEADIIQNELSKHLPRYMIPQVIRYFSEFPINSNGKLDRRLIADLISCS